MRVELFRSWTHSDNDTLFSGFAELMRSLGFGQQIPMDSFHDPNFPLVSEVLLWLALRFEPDANLPREIDSSAQRVYFIRSMVEFFVRPPSVCVCLTRRRRSIYKRKIQYIFAGSESKCQIECKKTVPGRSQFSRRTVKNNRRAQRCVEHENNALRRRIREIR